MDEGVGPFDTTGVSGPLLDVATDESTGAITAVSSGSTPATTRRYGPPAQSGRETAQRGTDATAN